MVADDPGIYVEILIRAGAEEMWRRTPIPDLHELWDLRFTSIHYLPRHSLCCFPAWPMFSEWYDETNRCFRVEVVVRNRTWGRLFGYRGHFQVERRSVASGVPEIFLPRRTEPRE